MGTWAEGAGGRQVPCLGPRVLQAPKTSHSALTCLRSPGEALLTPLPTSVLSRGRRAKHRVGTRRKGLGPQPGQTRAEVADILLP